MPLARVQVNGEILPESVRYLNTYEGLAQVAVDTARAGDIVVLAGLEGIAIGETLTDPEHPEPLPPIQVEEPTVHMTFGVNTSPFTGREGQWGTSRKLRQRLFDELRTNVALKVAEGETPDTFLVSGRGELHLAILIETLRREGYEFQVSKPDVILKQDDKGRTLEPFEDVFIETSPDTVGVVVEMLGTRRGVMKNMVNTTTGTVRLEFLVPTRGLLGFRSHFLSATRGEGVIHALFHGYLPHAGEISERASGSLVAFETGTTTTFGLKNAEERGILFYGAGTAVYAGMVVGKYQRSGDLDINVCKKKELTNMRAANADKEIRLTTPTHLSLEEAIEYLGKDELLEVTPLAYRMRKQLLDARERGRLNKTAKKAEVEVEN